MLCTLQKATQDDIRLTQEYVSNKLTGRIIRATNKSKYPQLYASYIPEDAWIDTWRMKIIVADGDGLVDTVNSALENQGIKLLSDEAIVGDTTVNGNPIAILRKYIYLGEYGADDHPDGTTFRRRQQTQPTVQMLVDHLTVELWPFVKRGRQPPLITAMPLLQLRRIAVRAAETPEVQAFKIQSNADGRISLEKEQWRELLGQTATSAPEECLFLIESAIEDRFFRISPLALNRAIMVDILHKYRRGHLAKLVKIIKSKLRKITIRGMYSYLTDSEGIHMSRFVLELPDGKPDRWKIQLKRAFAAAIKERFLDVDDIRGIVCYDPSAIDEPQAKDATRFAWVKKILGKRAWRNDEDAPE